MSTYIFKIKQTGLGEIRISALTEEDARRQYSGYLEIGMFQV